MRAALIQKQVNIGRVWSGRFGSHRQRLKDGLDWTSSASDIDWTSPQIIRMRRGEVDMEKELKVCPKVTCVNRCSLFSISSQFSLSYDIHTAVLLQT